MLKDPKIGAIVFSVKDIKRAEAFYGGTLGLSTRIIPGGHDSSGHVEGAFMIADVGEVSLIFFQRDEKPGSTPVVVFTLADGGIDDLVEQLARKGVPIVTPVSEAPGGWTSDFRDPDGHLLSFYQSNQAPRKRG